MMSLALLGAACSESTPTTLVADTRVDSTRVADGRADQRRPDLPAPQPERARDIRVEAPVVVDLPGKLDATAMLSPVVSEKWYQGGTSCGAAQMEVKAYGPTLDVKLLQIPVGQVEGTCSGHKAIVAVGGGTIQIEIKGNTGSACWTACWDFSFVIAPLPPGTYVVKYLGFTSAATISSYSG
jgi:hypothetical protein